MTGTVTAAQLKAIAGPRARTDLVSAIVRGWPAAVTKAKLTTRLRAAHFLAQIMTETGGLWILEESGAYKAPRIMEIFGVGNHSAAITAAEAKRIAALPVARRGPVLFNRVYGVGNPKKMREFSNTGPNDGWLYRGGGMMQATGKSNYTAMEKKTGLPLVAHPEMLHQPDSAFMAAYLEWAQDGRCNAAADRDDVVAVRKIINGGSNGLAECRTFLANAKKALADYSAAPVAAMFAEPPELEPEPEAPEVPAPTTWDPPAAVDPDVTGDPDLYSAQKRLKGRNYSPGLLDGKWGGATSGAISAFRNDSSLDFPMPQTLAEFHDIKDDLAAELQRWEDAERFRPVTPERKAGDPATVAAVAPEVVPVKRNFLAATWAAVLSFLTAIWDWLSGSISSAWDFFTDHKDDLPSDYGWLHSAWAWVSGLPPAVWAIAIGGLFLFIAMNSRASANKITESVSTGARQ
jgi:predicted chitinase